MSLLKRTRGIVATVLHQLLGNTETINSQSIIVLEKDSSGDVTRCKGTVTVTDAGSGYAKGCTYVKTDVASGTTGLYQNVGTNTSCLFRAVEGVEGVITAVVAGTGLTGGGTEGSVTVNVAAADSSITVAADAISVADGGVTNVKVADTTGAAGLALPKTAIVVYDFAVNGGAQGTIALTGSPTIPNNALVYVESYRVVSTLTSATDAATVALQLPTDGVLTTAIAISDGSNPWDAGVFSRIAGGLATPLTKLTTAARVPSLLVAGGENLTAGKIIFQLRYWVTA